MKRMKDKPLNYLQAVLDGMKDRGELLEDIADTGHADTGHAGVGHAGAGHVEPDLPAIDAAIASHDEDGLDARADSPVSGILVLDEEENSITLLMPFLSDFIMNALNMAGEISDQQYNEFLSEN